MAAATSFDTAMLERRLLELKGNDQPWGLGRGGAYPARISWLMRLLPPIRVSPTMRPAVKGVG